MQSNSWRQKIKIAITAFFIIILFTLLFGIYSNNNQINKHNNIGLMLNLTTEQVANFQQQIENLQLIIKDQNSDLLTHYIEKDLGNQQELFAKILISASAAEPLSNFWQQYSSLLRQLKINNNTGFSGNVSLRKLVRLLEATSEAEENIILMFQHRKIDNLDQLNSKIIIADILLMCLGAVTIAFVVFFYLCQSSLRKKTARYRALSLYFTEHPDVILRLSLNGRIKNTNAQAKNLINQLKIKKHDLLPNNITDYISQAVKQSEQVVYFKYQVAQNQMAGEVCFCKQSQHIYLTMIKQSQIESNVESDRMLEQA